MLAAKLAALEFLSTPSARRATHPGVLLQRARAISIHALREEGDLRMGVSHLFVMQFLSTPSARRATLIERAEQEIQGTFLSTPSARRATALIHGESFGF